MTGSLATATRFDVSRRRVVLIAARFNPALVDQLIAGASAAWRDHGGDPSRLLLERVGGPNECQVSCLVAEGVVDLLQIVDVTEKQQQRLSLAAGQL